MRSPRGGPAIGFVLIAVLVGAGAAGARPAQERPIAKVVQRATAPTNVLRHDGRHCHPVAPDPADL